MSNAEGTARDEVPEAPSGPWHAAEPSNPAGPTSYRASPVNTPTSRVLFGGTTSGSRTNSPALSSHVRLPGGEGRLQEAGAAHTAATQYVSPRNRALGLDTGLARASDAGSATEKEGSRTHVPRTPVAGHPGDQGVIYASDTHEESDASAGRYSETREQVPDSDIEREHKEKLNALRLKHQEKAHNAAMKLAKDKEELEREFAAEYHRKIRLLKQEHDKRSEKVTEVLNQEMERVHKAESWNADEIRKAERRERDRIKRKRGSMLAKPDEREPVGIVVIEPEPQPEREERDDDTVRVGNAGKEQSSEDEPPFPLPLKNKSTLGTKPRPSLGTNVTVMRSQLPATPAKGKEKENVQQVPTGGYLATMMAPNKAKSAETPAHTAGQTASSSRTVQFDTNRWPHRPVTSTSTPMQVASGGKPGGGDSEGSSSSDDEYKKMTPPEKRAYKKVKKEMREKMQRTVEDKERERKQREKIEKLKLSGYKTKLPTPYDGSADFDAYEKWIFEVNTWIRDTGFDDGEAISHVISFMEGKAGKYYMNNVATRIDEYDFHRLTIELFAHCFPPDINARLRRKFMNLSQTDRGFKDFVRELQKYQKRLSDITDTQVAQRIWEGAQSYLRIELAKAGYSAEENTVAELEESGIRFEMAEKIRKAEEDRRRNKENRDNKDYKPSRPNKSSNRGESSTESNKITYSKDSRPAYSQRNKDRREWKNKREYKPGPRLTKEQADQYRAAGKCFNCSEVGHTAKDCPKRNQAKPSTLSSSAIRYAHIEDMDDKRRELEINHVCYDAGSDDGDNEYSDGDDEDSLDKRVEDEVDAYIELYATKIRKNREHEELERNSATPKDMERKVAKAIVVEMFVNGKSCRVLLDSGSLGDFISTTTVDQLKIKTEVLAKPMGLAMAVAGSRGVIKHSATVNIKYQEIDDTYRLDVANLDRYDLILGTTFMYRHSIMLGFNPESVLVRSSKLLPLVGPTIKIISSNAADLVEAELDKIREMLRQESEDICKKASETPLPPLRVINHRIPLIDENKTYSWRSSRCPEALRNQWETKMKAYLDTGRWEFATGVNAIPMLLIPKKGVEGESTLRTVLDKREQNANTYKMSSPLPDIQEILWKVSKYKYRSLIDGKDAYEQIRVEPEDVPKTLFTTPSGTMTSKVMQIGDCNATATYQSLMNHLFAHAIGVYMHVFLDDIVVFTNSLEEHIKRVKEVFEVLRKQKLFLSPKKMQFLVEELHILGHIVDSRGIQMDPHKVDSVVNWKVPNTKDQLMSFIGAVGYLAPNCDGIRIPMGILTARASLHKHWNWDATAQRAFEETKEIVNKWRDHHRVALDYSEGAAPINLVTDASLTGASGILSQGEDMRTAKIAMFWSGKFTPTQQNYPVHELELYAIKESLDKFQYQLHGVKFRIYTDNKSLMNILTQKNLSGRQARWLEVINQFNFDIIHIPGVENKVADALSRIYADEPEGMVRAPSEYVPEDEDSEERMESALIGWDHREELTVPLLVANAAVEPASLDALEKEKEAEAISKGASEGASEQGTEEPDLPSKDTLRRYPGRERRQVIKYSAPPKPPKQKKVWNARKGPKAVTEGASTGSPQQTAETENKTENMTHQDGVSKEIAHQGSRAEDKIHEKATLVYYDASPTLLDMIKDNYLNDNLMSKVYANPSQYRNFDIQNGIIYISDRTGRAICVPKLSAEGLNLREMVIREAHELLKHAGSRKTLMAVRGKVWWESLVPDVKEYCLSCNVCATAKTSTQSKLGLLVPLKRPMDPWEQISIDFVGPLPESENLLGKWDMLLVAVDHATGMVRIVPTKQTYKSKDVAEIMYENIYKLHGIPRVIISDRDSLFTATFWSESNRLMGIQTRLSSAYHPETDGATERANKTIGSMIRQSIKGRQSDWVKYIPSIEYAMNASMSETTGYAPFYLNYGRIPPPMIWQTESQYSGVRRYLNRQREAIMRAHDSVIAARVRQTEQANKHRRAADFKVGDLVYLSSKNMRLPAKFSRKLTPKYIGPHRIVQEVTSGTTYKIDLPSALSARGIHPVFHASLLRPHIPNDNRKFPGRSGEQVIVLDKEPEEWAVDRIVTHAGKGRESGFKLLWKSGDYSWEKFEHIRHLEAMDAYLEAQGVDDATHLPWTDPKEEDVKAEEVDDKEGLEANRIELRELRAHICVGKDKETSVKKLDRLGERSHPQYAARIQPSYPAYIHSSLRLAMYNINQRHNTSLTRDQLEECIAYRDALNDYRQGVADHPGVEPRVYQLYRAIMIAGSEPDRTPRNPAPLSTRIARFSATEDGNIVDLATQTLQALRETQDALRDALRSAGTPHRDRRTRVEADFPRIPDGFTGTIGTTLASRIGATAAPKRITWPDGTGSGPSSPIPVYGNWTKRFSPYTRGKPSKRGRGSGRGGKRNAGPATLKTSPVNRPETETSAELIEIDDPSEGSGLGPTGDNTGSSTQLAQTDVEPLVESEDDGWNIKDYDDESW